MPPRGASLHRSAEVSDGQIAAPQKYLRIGDIGPLGKPYLFRRGIMLKIAFYLFRIHDAKLGKNPCSVKGYGERRGIFWGVSAHFFQGAWHSLHWLSVYWSFYLVLVFRAVFLGLVFRVGFLVCFLVWFFWSFFRTGEAIFCAEPRRRRISAAIGARVVAEHLTI